MAEFDGITLAELARMQVAGEKRTAQAISDMEGRVNKRLDEMQYVPRGEYEQRLKASEEKISDLIESKRWTTRAVASAILLTPISVALTTFVVTRT